MWIFTDSVNGSLASLHVSRALLILLWIALRLVIVFADSEMDYTLQPLYNTVRYNTVLDITRFKDGSQKCIDYIEK